MRTRGFTLIELMVVVAIIGILSAILFGLSGSSVTGTNAETVANEITTTLNFARMRAVATRAWHQVEVTGPQASPPCVPVSSCQSALIVWEAWNNCSTPPGQPLTGLALPTGGNQCWKVVQVVNLPTINVTVWNAQAGVPDMSGGASVAQNPALDFSIYFKPDGSTTSTLPPGGITGSTLFVSDVAQYKQWRVLVYNLTGSSYARNGW